MSGIYDHAVHPTHVVKATQVKLESVNYTLDHFSAQPEPFCHMNPCITQRIPYRALKSSRKVDECSPWCLALEVLKLRGSRPFLSSKDMKNKVMPNHGLPRLPPTLLHQVSTALRALVGWCKSKHVENQV